MLDRVGVKLTLDAVEPVAWEEKVRVAGDFELATRQSGVVADPAQDLLAGWAAGGTAPRDRATVPGLLEALQQADGEPDEQRRHQLFVEAQKLLHASAWSGDALVRERQRPGSQADPGLLGRAGPAPRSRMVDQRVRPPHPPAREMISAKPRFARAGVGGEGFEERTTIQ